MAKNNNLSKAKKAKNDEFYTRLEDIEREVFHYKKHFAGKVVYCNCDDPAESNFFKYFALNIKAFQLKKLIATCYDGGCRKISDKRTYSIVIRNKVDRLDGEYFYV